MSTKTGPRGGSVGKGVGVPLSPVVLTQKFLSHEWEGAKVKVGKGLDRSILFTFVTRLTCKENGLSGTVIVLVLFGTGSVVG